MMKVLASLPCVSRHDGCWNVDGNKAICLVSCGCIRRYCRFCTIIALSRFIVWKTVELQRDEVSLSSRESTFGSCVRSTAGRRSACCSVEICWLWMFAGTDRDPLDVEPRAIFSLDCRGFFQRGCSIWIGGMSFPQGISFCLILYCFFVPLLLLLWRDLSETSVANWDTFPAPRRQNVFQSVGRREVQRYC